MSLPYPEPGLVIRHSYLWRHEHESGKEEGRKYRPCVIILSVERQDNETVITIAPITHSQPISNPSHAIEIPPVVKRHLGLDEERSWVILTEVNQFTWPGYDLQHIPGDTERYDYGFLPPRLFERIKNSVTNLILERRGKIINRD